MAIKIEMLRCFAAVAQSGNLADAANKLGRTPSAVSMMLRQLEDHLGTALFEAGRKSRLTPLGRLVLDESLQELDHFGRTVATIESFARADSGFVRVAAVPSVAEAILPQVVQGFLRDRPGVQIDIRDMDSAAVVREIARERVDIGIATGTEGGAGIDRATLFSDAFGVVCRADHPLVARNLPLHWDALEGCVFIANGLCRHISNENFQRIFNRSHLMVRNTTSLLAMVRAGVGVTVLPRLSVHRDDSKVKFLPVADRAALRRIEILFRAHSSLSPAAQCFEAAVRSTAREVALD